MRDPIVTDAEGHLETTQPHATSAAFGVCTAGLPPEQVLL